MILLLLLLLDQHHFLLIFLQLLLLVANKVTELHLLLNQVLGLRKRANKLVSFLSLHLMNFVLVPHVDPFEILLFVLQLHLLIAQLSLLLVFRTNSAYERMWLSRGILEDLVNCSRQLAIMLEGALKAAKMDATRTGFLRHRYVAMLTTLPKLLLVHVAYEAETKKLVKNSEMKFSDQKSILDASNAPLRCIQLMQDSLDE